MNFDPQFIKDVMREDDRPFFRILNTDGNVVYAHFTPGSSVETAIGKFDKFMKACDSGFFKMELYKSDSKMSKRNQPILSSDFLEYLFLVTPSLRENVQPQQNQGMGNVNQYPQLVPGISNELLDRLLSNKDEIQKLQVQLATMEATNALKNDFDARTKEHEKQMAAIQSTQGIQGILKNLAPELAPQILGQITNLFGGKPAPINGIMEPPTGEVVDARQRILNAVNKLIKLDPEFADNIERLVSIAENDPAVYTLAINKLKALV